MKTIRNNLLALFLCIGLLYPVFTIRAASAQHVYTAAEVESLCGGIVAYKASRCGVGTAQELIDRGLTDEAGTTGEYYAITLSQSGSYDMRRYEQALLNYLDTHDVYSATTREKYALTLLACGSHDSYIRRVCDEDIGGLGLMSLVFGLHLLNNGCTSALYDTGSLIDAILSCQLSDGGWAVIGSAGDADVTSMVIQALAPYYCVYGYVTSAVDRALDLLSRMQLSSGGYRSMGAENCESAAQVLCALSSLGIDAQQDGRFIKNSNTVLDAMLGYRNADGSFSHTGSSQNENATIQAFYSLLSYLRMQYGQSPYYILDSCKTTAGQQPPTGAKNGTKNSSGGSNSANGGSRHDSGQHSAGAEQDQQQNEIIYISGNAYIKATDSSGGDVTIAVTEPPTAAEISPSVSVQSASSSGGDARSDETTAPASDAPRGGSSYKVYVILAILLFSVGAAIFLYLMKKRGKKHYIALGVLTAAAILFILLTNFESSASYHQTAEKTDVRGAVTMTIRCDTVADESDLPDTIPDDGVILPETSFTISEGETVYDVLLEVSKTYNIPIDNRGSDTAAYIAGIDHLYEFDYGDLSGWMYTVNGEFPQTGCQSYQLSDGDAIEWRYTCDIGKDIGDSQPPTTND